jgi:hypothetical protein
VTPPARRHQSWDEFQLLVSAGHPALVTIPGTPAATLFAEAGASRIGLRIDATGQAPVSPLVEITIEAATFQGRRVLDVSTRNPALYREFYDFACAVSDRAQLMGRTPAVAITESLEAWGELLQRLSLLGPDRELGLIGELWMLRRLALAVGYSEAISAWRGSESEEHDFGLKDVDIEVKTTTSERRTHMIGSLSQLMPSPHRSLYLLSVQLTRNTVAAGGWTVSQAIKDVRTQVAGDETPSTEFNRKLALAGWRDEHAAHYPRRFVLRSQPALISVDADCPAITRDLIALLGPQRSGRILAVRYEIDVTGFGDEDGTARFLKVIPRPGISHAN